MLSISSASSTQILLLGCGLLPSLVRATCYWQNSTLAPDSPYSIAQDDTACFPDQNHSPCCGTGWTCLSDGVCKITQEGNDFYYRGTCTDKTWNSQQCPGWCFAQNSNTSIPLGKCDTDQDWYCCPGDPNCDCSTGTNVVKLGAAQPSTVTVIGSTTWSGMTSTTSGFTEQPLNTAGTTTTATTDSSRTSSTSGTSPVGSAAGAATTSAEATGASSSGAGGSGGSNHTALGVGLGFGLGIGAVLIASLAWLLLRRRRKRNAAATAAAATASGSVDGKGHYSPDGSWTTDASHAGYYGDGSQGNFKAGQNAAMSTPAEMDNGQGVRAELTGAGGGRVELGGDGRRVHEMQG